MTEKTKGGKPATSTGTQTAGAGTFGTAAPAGKDKGGAKTKSGAPGPMGGGTASGGAKSGKGR